MERVRTHLSSRRTLTVPESSSDLQLDGTMFSLLVLLALGCLSREAWSCTCGPRHPQSVYCDSAVVIRARFVAQKESPKSDQRMQFQIKTMKVFKAPTGVEDIQYLYSSKEESLCGYKHSSTNKSEEFLVAGHIVDEDVFINTCSFVVPWASLSYCQKRGFLHVFAKNCGCQIKPCFGAPCQVENKLQCLWSDPMNRIKNLHSSHQAANLACVRNDDLCVWDSLKSRLYAAMPIKSAAIPKPTTKPTTKPVKPTAH